jgi:hypothetical protein
MAVARAFLFVTLDRKHFLENALLAGSLPFPMGTPGDLLAWLKQRLAGA